MENTRLNFECISCLLDKHLKKIPQNADESLKLKYAKELLKMIYEAKPQVSAPEITEQITELYAEIFGFSEDFTEIKRYFNELMLSKETQINTKIQDSKDKLCAALKYAMLGNYIDFGAMNSVDENKLSDMLENVQEIEINNLEYNNFKKDLKTAKKLVYLTDNCGEIALDKQFLKQIKLQFPKIELQVIVRGKNVLNDATMEDALQVGMPEIAPVIGNGSGVAGNSFGKISAVALEKINNADVIIAKGQGNFETLCFCGKNIYYIFMCKCKFFANRFGVPQYTGMLLNDLRMK